METKRHQLAEIDFFHKACWQRATEAHRFGADQRCRPAAGKDTGGCGTADRADAFSEDLGLAIVDLSNAALDQVGLAKKACDEGVRRTS